jgi:Fe-S-cluster containining protein
MSRRVKEKKPKAKPKAPDFNLTPQGVLIKTSNQPDAIRVFDEKLVGYEKQLQSMDSDYAHSIAVSKIQIVVDAAATNSSRPISCKAGCSACCHQKVDLGAYESSLIEAYLKEHRIVVDAERLRTQTEALKGGVGSFEKLPFDDRRCVFLSADQICSIYSVRPLMCRRHFVKSDPALCRSEEFFRLEMDVNSDTDAYLSAYVTRHATKSLPEFLQSLKA